MTCCLAASSLGGVVVASDSLLTIGESKLYSQSIKAKEYGSLFILYAGNLAEIDRLFSEAPNDDTDFTDLQKFQHRLWALKKLLSTDAYEFLAVDDEGQLHILSGHGDVVSGFDYACVGSELGWMGLDLLMPEVRNPTASNIKTRLLKVLRAVARRDNTVSGPMFSEVL
jgi:ATP-dependent protease HslVU (ClpYQ) peptidase subunit